MKKIIILILLILSITYISYGQVRILHHDEDMAARSAEKFAKTTFVDQDFNAGYSLILEKYRKDLSLEEFTDMVNQLHPKGYPTEIKAIEFEPILGQAGMRIFLEGMNHNEQFYYHFVMEGEKATGYTVLTMFRGETEYPPSKLKKKLNP